MNRQFVHLAVTSEFTLTYYNKECGCYSSMVAVVKAVVEQLDTHSQSVRKNGQNSSSAANDNEFEAKKFHCNTFDMCK